MVVIQLGFKKSSSEDVSLRDRTLMTFFQSSKSERKSMLEKNTFLKQTIDPLHSINMINICAYLQHVDHLKDLVELEMDYFIDSNDRSPSDKLMECRNYQGIGVLFELTTKKKYDVPYLDETMLYWKLKHDAHWVVEHNNFEEPKTLKVFKNPMYGILKNGESQQIFLHSSQYASEDLVAQYIDFEPRDKQEIVVMVSAFSLNLESGSNRSMEFLEMIQEVIDEALYTNFALALEYKWIKDKKYVMLLAIVYFLYVILIDFRVPLHKNNESSPILDALIVLFVILLASYELTQAYFVGFAEYFLDIENYLDLSAIAVIGIYTVVNFMQLGTPTTRSNVLCLGVFLSNTRCMFHLTVFSPSFRAMMTVIVNAFIQLSSFLLILLMFVFILAISQYPFVDPQVGFFETIMKSYLIMFGENPPRLANEQGSLIVLYVVGTSLIVIVCLNILISVVTDNYDNV